MSHLLVAAIDFGTTYSGWAFSFKHEFERDPIKISSKNWTGGSLVSQKGPTCVLIHSDGKTLDSFGYDAETRYSDLIATQTHKDWYFFERFKMALYNRIGIERNILIEDASGKRLLAKTVFSLCIQHLKDDLIETSGKRLADGNIRNRDIHWVLTVPAIWNDAAKQFMREAAKEAGIADDQLTIALEPEAASIFCRHLPVERTKGSEKLSLASFKAGTKYLVLDAGGGTIDITVHKILPNGELQELHKASGGDWGGTKVDRAFENLLEEIVGKEVFSKFKTNHLEDYIDLMRDFEIKKRESRLITVAKVTMRTPLSLVQLANDNGKTLQECIRSSPYSTTISITGDKMRIECEVMKSLFANCIQSILQHLEMLLRQPAVRGCDAILMVGGFSESPILQKAIEERFGELKIIIPDEAGLAVLKGAVIFGHNPTTIAERVCKFTYGVNTTHRTKPDCNHPSCPQKQDKDGTMRCKDLFSRHVKVNQSVKLGEETESKTYRPTHKNQRNVGFDVYVSPDPNPFLVTEQGCSKLGTISVDIPDTGSGNARDRKILVSFLFGGTEIEVKAIDTDSKKTTKGSVDFLG